jgi:hypothetical protein
MSRRLAIMAAVFLKDLRLHWPLAAFAAATILAPKRFGGDFGLAGLSLGLVAVLAASLLVLSLVHQDAPASVRHDWLTRPVGRLNLLLAKALLAAAAVLLPLAMSAALAAVLDGASAPEAALAAIAGTGTYLLIGFGLLAVAAITSNLLEAAGLLIGIFLLLFVLAPNVLLRSSGLSEPAMTLEPAIALGSGWVVLGAFSAIVLVGGLVVLWLQYAVRRGAEARGAFAATVGVFAATMALLSWDAVFAAQRAVSGRESSPDRFSVALAPGCFEARTIDPPAGGMAAGGPWTAEQLRNAGFGAVSFWTDLRSHGVPEGWRMMIGHVRGSFVDDEGKTLDRLEPSVFIPLWHTTADERLEARHPWLLSRARFDDLAERAAGFRLDYQLTLLAPAHAAEIVADGRRRRLPGIGSCAASVGSGAVVEVTCFKVGRQPDLLTARPTGGEREQDVASGAPSYAPGLLQLSAGRRYQMTLRAASSRVTITAYEAEAHVAHRVTAPGVLGGPAAACLLAGVG